MKPVARCLLIAFVVVTASCAPKPKDMLIGKWRTEDHSETLEYHADGRLTGTGPAGAVNLKWKFKGSKYVEWTRFDEEKQKDVKVGEVQIFAIDDKKLHVGRAFDRVEQRYLRVR